MSKVAAVLKVMPDSPDIDLDGLEADLSESLPDGAEINGTDTEEVAFGLTALLTTVIVPDDSGGTEAVEDAFGAVDDVESVSVEEVGRL
ncbi:MULTISPECIES: elongation factor 1-beta [Halobacterium]|uniref:Elongation factor 1-beta n=5 Tax=Halobacterium salinarum TaxID=2242 RepID=EF1B_HALSA|nr:MULTISPECIES: elongation factor 1-beta [Halobacterium]B0R511.1 RecName: Full=Elongation factor 1-beta; Short=EF-1-beta; AltName: Full=aEF-1beta [Halobacterium salinarum R1]Q9HQG6.2 RecName: Full=Elongation factor 1-beta; Short=EF-1-beta; AltName: Full=aEF-1beta [Halobacterium salinarum NRC-1]MBB6090235.1 elongation factor 1-beta [Halobacterium salinarum]MCF2165058.1 elongation factor 1-beta [Halobacterium salinarum]MCF2168605.1 elongation factor 1-beta [Halobacterium salinarum]MCF2206968.1